MAVPILMITHNSLGKTLYDICAQIITPLPTTIDTLDIPFDIDADQFYQRALQICEPLCQENGILVLTDLNGSTPANIAKRLHQKDRCIVVTGLNLSMLLKALNYCHLSITELAKKTGAGGRDGVEIYNP